MKCKKCNAEVSIADSKCPQCGNDLLQFGATTFYDPKERDKGRYGKKIKDRILGDLGKEMKKTIEGFDPQEREILQPIETRLRSVLLRSLSDSEWEKAFDDEILPTIDALSRDRSAEKIFKKVEETIKDNLGHIVFNHYKNKVVDVLKILRAGEITCILMREDTKETDLSVKMFPFFKASELACWRHIHDRYKELKGSPLIKAIAEWIGNNVDNVFIERIPNWIVERKKTLLEILNGILVESEYHLSGSLRTGVSLYILGRDWILGIERKDLSKIKEFQIRNILKAKGTDKDKETLAENLYELQILRNERIHRGIEENEKTVQQSRMLSYNCLKKIPEILEI
jgi:hypothetical protein